MSEVPKKIKRAAGAVAGAVASEVAGNALIPGSPGASAPPPQPAAAETAHDVPPHEYVPEVETSSVTRGEDGHVEAQTGTVWQPETTDGLPLKDLPTVEEFEQIEVHEDEFGNFIIDATERFVVHNNGRDEVYTDHQHLVVPGDGTPGDTDIDIVQDADVVIHENPDGTITVEHQGSLTYELTPDAPGHGDIEIFQDETVLLDEAETGPPGIDVGVTVDQQARADDPFGEPAGPTIHQTEVIADKGRGATVTAQVTAPAPALPGTPAAPVVTFSRQPSTVDTPVPQPVAVEATTLAASNTLAEHPVVKHSFATDREPAHHDAGEVTGTHPVEREHPFEPPRHPEPDHRPDTGHVPDAGHLPDPPPEPHDPPPAESPGPPEHHDSAFEHYEDPEPEAVPADHSNLDHAHTAGGG
ncbi:hypothetical protein SAMN05421837_10219 [Amycolatopsis pretoriensis]|uniref:Uncharacterized protein n=1 Tax=Amycolatopsis pretoriensis TaxID=218821 RepID=A0A1H5QAG8_9PSEU|nr:hypothetical protein [Amycolatopsis pretoriensis]SEF23123.1 hypothetical protein SAMN05421837_10219 [Amycolatopsis pretoriensis]